MATIRKKMYVEYDDSSDLTKSQKVPGKSSPLTRERGTNNLGQVVLSDIDEDDEGPPVHVYLVDSPAGEAPPARPLLTEEEKARIVGALYDLAVWARPHVQRWLIDRAAPAVRSAWGRWRSRERGRTDVRAGRARSVQAAVADGPLKPGDALEERQPTMSTEEKRRRFVAALLHRLYSEEQLRMIQEAHTEDDGGDLQELDSMLDKLEHLTVRQLRSAITQVLDADPSLAIGVPVELESVLGPTRPDGRVLESRKRSAKSS
ncbi:hypothetical protein [Micromonospora sp. NPDC005324]|uniref:hypothetical protein n=1 Tax=Micromonospora sp. NPDC005324 TaxID=3157033 RepID=UPI0033B3D5C2